MLDLLDGAASAERAFGWVADACQRRLTTPVRLAAAFDRRPGTRWAATLRPALEEIAGGSHTVLERAYLTLNRRHDLPEPVRQRRLEDGGFVRWVDCDYRPFPVRTELDGRLGHDRGVERWRDMHRDNAAAAAGVVSLRSAGST